MSDYLTQTCLNRLCRDLMVLHKLYLLVGVCEEHGGDFQLEICFIVRERESDSTQRIIRNQDLKTYIDGNMDGNFNCRIVRHAKLSNWNLL